MRRRPLVEVFVSPGRVYPGQDFEVTIRLDSKAKTPTEGTRVTLVGTERVRDSENWTSIAFLSLAATFDSMVLAPGKHALRARFSLPAEAPPTHKAQRSAIAYELRVYVDIPWWPDVDKTFEITVSPPPVAAPSTDVVFSSRRGEAVDDLYAEMTLARSIVAPGGAIRGAVSLTNTPRGKPLRVDAAFIATEGLHYPGETLRYSARIHDGPLDDGVAVPFAISLPDSAPTSFAGRASRLVWTFNLWVTAGWSKKPLMSIPIQVWPTTGEAGPAKLAAVGKSRRAQLWATVGPELGFAYDAESDELAAAFGDLAARIGVEPRPDGRSFMIGRLTYPWLGLHLTVAKKSWLSGVTGAYIETGEVAFDRAFTVHAREPEQATALLGGAAADALAFFSEIHMTDEGATVGVKGAGMDASALRLFLGALRAASASMAGRLASLPLPAQLRSRRQELETLAARLGGRLFPSAPSILGAERAHRAITIRFEVPAEGAPPTVTLATPIELEPGATKSTSKRVVAARAELEKAGVVTQSDRSLELASWTLPDDLTELERRIDALVDLADLLESRGAQGPYR